MDLKLISIFFIDFIVLSANALKVRLHGPQVYENVNEGRAAQKFQRFNYLGATNNQIDLQKWRYRQQQRFQLSSRTFTQNPQKREVQSGIYLIPKAPLINYGLNYANNLKLLEESFGPQQEKDIQALNGLIGKTPTAQLEGLKHLLNPKDYTPITEEFVDVANPQTRPNIQVVTAPPEYQQVVAQAQIYEDAQKKINGQNLLNLEQVEKRLNDFARGQAERIYAKAQNEVVERIVEQQARDDAAKQEESYNKEHYQAENKKTENNNLQYASQYAFGYRVRDYHSENDFGHEEISDGHTAKGHYHVFLPDGRVQRVQYWADHTGFHAKVTYDKLAQHTY